MVLGAWWELDKYLLNEVPSELAFQPGLLNSRAWIMKLPELRLTQEHSEIVRLNASFKIPNGS